MRQIFQIISEIGLIFFYPISALFAFLAHSFFGQENQDDREGKVIVIVERWLSKNIKHIQWKSYLEKKGFRVYLVNFSLYKGSFENSALDLKEYLESKNLKNVVLVGISSGALTSLLYLQEHGGWDRVDKFITVGAPFKGTWAAMTLTPFYSGRQLLPNSDFVKKISKYEVKNLGKIYCFRSSFDEMVPYGSVLKGSHELRVNTLGHNNLHLGLVRTYSRIADLARKDL